MFGLVVDEIIAVQKKQEQFEKSLEHRHRINLSLNNEVCAKLEKLERELELKSLPPHTFHNKKTSQAQLHKTISVHNKSASGYIDEGS